jgi:hypothetical protein
MPKSGQYADSMWVSGALDDLSPAARSHGLSQRDEPKNAFPIIYMLSGDELE